MKKHYYAVAKAQALGSIKVVIRSIAAVAGYHTKRIAISGVAIFCISCRSIAHIKACCAVKHIHFSTKTRDKHLTEHIGFFLCRIIFIEKEGALTVIVIPLCRILQTMIERYSAQNFVAYLISAISGKSYYGKSNNAKSYQRYCYDHQYACNVNGFILYVFHRVLQSKFLHKEHIYHYIKNMIAFNIQICIFSYNCINKCRFPGIRKMKGSV